MKSKCGIRNAACSSAQAIFTNSNPPPPALLLAILAGAHFTFPPLTSRRAILTLSSLSVSAGWTDAWESWQRRTNLTRQTSHRRTPPPPPPPPPPPSTLGALPHPPLSLCHPFYLFQPLIYPLPLQPPPPPPRAPASPLCITYGLAAGSAAVLETAWGLRSHLVLSRAKPSFRKAS